MKKNIAIAIFAAALIVALAAAAGPSEETGGQVQPMDPYGLQTTCIGPDGGTYSCRVPVPAAGVFVNGGWVQQTTCTTTPATGSPGSSTTYPMATENMVQAPSGSMVLGQGTAGGVNRVTHDGMCFGTTCLEVDMTALGAAASSATLTSNTWYSIDVSDPNGNLGDVECHATSLIPTLLTCGASDAGCVVDAGGSCYGKGKFQSGVHFRAYAPLASVDAGPAPTTTLYFYSILTTPLTVTLCPQVPCF